MKRVEQLFVSCTTAGLCLLLTACGGGSEGGSTFGSGGGYNGGATTYTLTVNSTNPSGGVSIDVSPADVNNASSGSTSFTRTYTAGTAVTLTAPTTSGSNPFSSWTGCGSASSVTCTVMVSANTTVTAAYSSPSLSTPTVTVTPASTSITAAQPLSVTIAVQASTGNSAPTGSVTLAGGGYTSSSSTALANGSATVMIAAGSLAVGSDTLTATYTPDSTSSSIYNSATGTGSVTVTAASGTPAAQTITFNNPGAQTVGTPLTLSATASSNLTVSFASTTASVCTVSGATATFISAGTCTIQATQAGNSAYAAATLVPQSFPVNAAATPPTVTLTAYPTTVATGGKSTLSWSSTHAASCTAQGGWAGTLAVSGMQSVTPTTTNTYTITCSGTGGGSASAMVTVTVTGGSGNTGGTFTLSAPAYTVTQSAGSLTVTVARTGGNIADAVNYATSDGLAVAGTDYTATSGTLSFAAGDTSHTLTIPIRSATPFVGYKTFNITLSNPTAGATLGTTVAATATIFGTAAAPNANSPLGINLNGVSYYTPEQPFINIFKTSGVASPQVPGWGWVTSSLAQYETTEEAYLQLDADGYPTTLTAAANDPNKPQQFDRVTILLLYNLGASNAGTGPSFRAGQYVVLYDGEGTIQYGLNVTAVQHASPGRDVLTVSAPTGTGEGQGIGISITATDPNRSGNYIRNIRVVYASEESLLASGAIFRPGLLTQLQNFHAFRFMDWLQTNRNPLTRWADRPQLSNGGWGSNRGVPLEVPIALSNALHAAPWLNVPAMVDDDYITQMATLVHNTLDPSLPVYVEVGNEMWNYSFSQAQYAQAQGLLLWPQFNTNSDGPYGANRNWYGMRVAQTCDIWAQVWGNDFKRVHCMLNGQEGNSFSVTYSLACTAWTGSGNAPCANHHITDVAYGGYFGHDDVPVSWVNGSTDLTTAVDRLFTQINSGGLISGAYPTGYLNEVSAGQAQYAKDLAAAGYHFPMLVYEGGVGFDAGGTQYQAQAGTVAEFQQLYDKANRDGRMGTAYKTLLDNWKTNGGHLFMQFTDIGQYSAAGEWGALENYLDTTDPAATNTPPKWAALENFISDNPCWWTCNQ